jgi:membrane-associated phospholipid phosphatase
LASVVIAQRLGGFLLALLALQPAGALADSAEDGPPAVLAFPDQRRVDTAHRLEWQWKKVHWGELVSTAALAATGFGVSQAVEPSARWTRANAFDDWFRDRLGAEGATLKRLDRASDVLQWTSIGFPVLIDSVGVALIGDKNREVGGQLLAIQAQAFAMTGFLTSSTKAAAGRVRPYAEQLGCADPGVDCGGDANRSYFSGHTSYAFAGAGLTCVAHRHLRPFGRVGDPLICALALSMASATGVLRIGANEHWATDVLSGAGVGLFSGWLMPWLLHFRHDTSERRAAPGQVLRFLAPYGSRRELGLTLAGAF